MALKLPRTTAGGKHGINREDIVDLSPDDILRNSNDSCKSFLFGQVGDGRHLFKALDDIAFFERHEKDYAKGISYHFSVTDSNVLVLCRLLIILVYLSVASDIDQTRDEMAFAEAMNALCYLFCAPLMPPFAYDGLMNVIGEAVNMLKGGIQPLDWFVIPDCDFPRFIEGLESWQGDIREDFAAKMFLEAAEQMKDEDKFKIYKGHEQEVSLYKDFFVPFPSQIVVV